MNRSIFLIIYIYIYIIIKCKLSIRGIYKEVYRALGLEVKLKKLKFREFRNRSLKNSEIEIQRIQRLKSESRDQKSKEGFAVAKGTDA